MGRKKYSCDFETTTKAEDCRVWAWGWMEIGNTDNYAIGNNMGDFMEWAISTPEDLYFHNLRFDGSYIINYLLKAGWEFSTKAEPHTFNVLISKMGQWYMIDLCHDYIITPKGKRKIHTAIYDSLKKLPFPVAKIAKDFNLPFSKGDIDYHLERPEGWIITPEEEDYLIRDIKIIALALETQFKQGMTSMTNGADSLSSFKDIISRKRFEKLFPVFSENMFETIKQAYRGGFTWVNEKYQGKMLYGGKVYDVNSLYPYIMFDRILPFSMPLSYEGEYEQDEHYPLWVQHITCDFELKEGHIPTIQLKKNMMFKQNEYLKTSNYENPDLYVTNIDWELIKEHYHVFNVQFHRGLKFRAKKGIFKEFIEKWMYVKITSTGAKKLLAKLQLNSLYGKFGSSIDVTGKEPYLKEDGSNGFRAGAKTTKDPIYNPMAVFVTSYARDYTIRTAQSVYDRIIYCDTDSIHIVGDDVPEVISSIIDPDKLGHWKHEYDFTRGKFLRQKTYMEQIKGKKHSKEIGKNYKGKKVKFYCPKIEVKCAGMPEKIKHKVTFKNFEVGFTSHGKLMPKQVSGGVILEDKEFSIR